MKIFIKFMVSIRCKIVVKDTLKRLGIHYSCIDLGVVELSEALSNEQRGFLKASLKESGLELMDDKRAILIERIKNTIVEMVHYSDELPKIKTSCFLAEKLEHDYKYLSNIFSETTGVTIEHYVISHKIEKAKELLLYNELNLTEISYKLQYSSVAHLSNQFKKVTGLSPSFYKQMKEKRNKNLEDL